jgi:hypothetical protein
MMPLGEHQFIYLNFEWRTDATELAGAPFFKNLANTLTPSRLVWFTLRAVFSLGTRAEALDASKFLDKRDTPLGYVYICPPGHSMLCENALLPKACNALFTTHPLTSVRLLTANSTLWLLAIYDHSPTDKFYSQRFVVEKPPPPSMDDNGPDAEFVRMFEPGLELKYWDDPKDLHLLAAALGHLDRGEYALPLYNQYVKVVGQAAELIGIDRDLFLAIGKHTSVARVATLRVRVEYTMSRQHLTDVQLVGGQLLANELKLLLLRGSARPLPMLNMQVTGALCRTETFLLPLVYFRME